MTEAPPYIWIMQYYGPDNELMTWPDYFPSPEQGEKVIEDMNRNRLVTSREPISVAWYKQVWQYEKDIVHLGDVEDMLGNGPIGI